jgi:hypothetical protein
MKIYKQTLHYHDMKRRGSFIFLPLISIIFLVTPGFHDSLSVLGEETVSIRVAIYDSLISEYAQEAYHPLNFTWTTEGQRYMFHTHIVDRGDIMGHTDISLSSDYFDVFVVPGSGRPYIDALHPRWRNTVTSFVDMGGGYIGICGGANLASRGFQEKGTPNGILNRSVLQLANVYVNNQQEEEWMYLWKANWQYGLPPVRMDILANNNPIFQGYYGETRSIRYGGGPGMYEAHYRDEKYGDIIPLAIYGEEPMLTAPLHYWRWTKRTGWEISANVTTDIKDQYAAIATSYGQGRLALFGPHPEKKTFFGGRIEEFPVRPHLGPFTWFIYNWSGGIVSPQDYNWGILRRSTAWASRKVPESHLPPLER